MQIGIRTRPDAFIQVKRGPRFHRQSACILENQARVISNLDAHIYLEVKHDDVFSAPIEHWICRVERHGHRNITRNLR